MTFSLKGVPRNLRAQFRAMINGAIDACIDSVQDFATDMTTQVEAATSTWSNPVKFTIKRGGHSSRTMTVHVNHPYFSYVNDGTNYRWAVMSGDWKSKSAVRSLHAGPGAGRVWLKGRKQMNAMGFGYPKPGIEARQFFVPAALNSAPKLHGWLTQHLRRRGLI